MRIAIEGCAHGELERIYETISEIEKKENYKVDLLICCGDFQASRNLNDLQTMAVPKKYQEICTFYKYYSGEKIAPMLTIFVGGNHEASNHLQELPYGGWVAPNIYYLGYAGVVNVNGIRIAGISGIFKGHDFLKGHHEFAPYSESTRKSVYHTRQLEVFRLKQLSGNIDIFVSHDWPRGIYNFGNAKQLVRFKPHFRDEIENNKLGSPACEDLLNTLQPTYWFSAHMHCKFAALVPHENTGKVTKFLALDKCLPKRRFLQILNIDTPLLSDTNPETTNTYDNHKLKFEYDIEWLTILYLTNHLINVKNTIHYMPGPNNDTERYNFTPTDNEKDAIRKKFSNDFIIPENFVRNTEPYNPTKDSMSSFYMSNKCPSSKMNPQTTNFCDILCIDDPLKLAMTINGHDLNKSDLIIDNNSEINSSSFIMDTSEQSSFNSTFNSPLKRKSSLELPKPKLQNQNASNNTEEIFFEDVDGGGNDDDDNDNDDYDNDDVHDNNDDEVVTGDDGGGENESKIKDISDIIDSDVSVINISSESSRLECSMTSIINPTTTKLIEENTESTENSSNPPIKKFKRRNQSIYSTSNDEDA